MPAEKKDDAARHRAIRKNARDLANDLDTEARHLELEVETAQSHYEYNALSHAVETLRHIAKNMRHDAEDYPGPLATPFRSECMELHDIRCDLRGAGLETEAEDIKTLLSQLEAINNAWPDYNDPIRKKHDGA